MRGCQRRGLMIAALLVGLVLLARPAAAADQVTLTATLIHASNAKGPIDPSLKPLEGNLRRMFKFQTYKRYGGGTVTTALPSKSDIGLGHANQLTVSVGAATSDVKRVEAHLDWRGPTGKIQNTSAVLTRGGPPMLLGGAQQDGGTLIIAITAK